MDMRSLLGEMVERGASDLYLTADSPPMLRIEGITEPFGTEQLGPKEVELLANSLMSDQYRGFESRLTV